MSSRSFRKVERSFFIHAPPREVFRAISEPQGLARWMVERARLPLQTGAKYALVFQGGWRHRGTVVRFRPGSLLSLSWAWDGVPLSGTVLTLSVKAARGGTVVKFVHSGFPREERWVDLYGVTEWGWTYYGMNLKSVLEADHDLRSELDR